MDFLGSFAAATPKVKMPVSISAVFKTKIQIGANKYSVLNTIGEGGFAFVYRVKKDNMLRSGGGDTHLALKKMICQSQEQLTEANKEIDVLNRLQHENVLKLLGSESKRNDKGQMEVYLLLPLYSGTVQSVIESASSRGWPHCPFSAASDVMEIIRGTLEGLIELHALGYRHGDLKPANILLTNRLQAVVTDFGSVSPVCTDVESRHAALALVDYASSYSTASIRSPELFEGTLVPGVGVQVDARADVWALGCTIFAAFFCRTPFETPAEGFSTLAALSSHYSFPEGHPWPVEYVEMVKSCLQADHSQRVTPSQLRENLRNLPAPPTSLEHKTLVKKQAEEYVPIQLQFDANGKLIGSNRDNGGNGMNGGKKGTGTGDRKGTGSKQRNTQQMQEMQDFADFSQQPQPSSSASASASVFDFTADFADFNDGASPGVGGGGVTEGDLLGDLDSFSSLAVAPQVQAKAIVAGVGAGGFDAFADFSPGGGGQETQTQLSVSVPKTDSLLDFGEFEDFEGAADAGQGAGSDRLSFGEFEG